MSGLTILVFYLPAESGEKCGLGITIMLSFAVFMLSVIQKLPDTSESFPLISIYLTVVMSMTAVTVCISVFVLSLNYQSTRDRPVPRTLRKMLNKFAPLCCVHDEPYIIPTVSAIESSVSTFLKRLGTELLTQLEEPKFMEAKRQAKQYQRVISGLHRIVDRQLEANKTNVISHLISL